MIRTQRAHLNVAAISHPGLSGKNNEDRFAVSSYRIGLENPTPVVFAVVADGIGGHRAGEVAADVAVNTISHTVAKSDASQPLKTLQQAIETASCSIASHARDDTRQMGMGATCACAWVIGDLLFTASVGDSRIYLLRGLDIHQLTVDHTWVQEAQEKGILEAGQESNHPNVHVLHRHLGSEPPPQPDLRLRLRPDKNDTQAESNQGFLLHSGDTLLLCTDGLTDRVADSEIRAALHASRNLEAAAQTLINMANRRGGHDNITVVLLNVPGRAQKKRGKSPF